VYARWPDVDEVVVFGCIPEKLAKISGQFGFAITTDLDAVLAGASVDLIDICRCRMILPFSAVVLLLHR
jgi:predicted dehydrogenase